MSAFDPNDESLIQISNSDGLRLFRAAEIPMRHDPTWSIAMLVPCWAQSLRSRLPVESSRVSILREARDPETRRAIFAIIAVFDEYDWEQRAAMVQALDAFLREVGVPEPFLNTTDDP